MGIFGLFGGKDKKNPSEINDGDIAADYGKFIEENYRVNVIWDISKLPYPKENIIGAILRLHAKEQDDWTKTCLVNCFLYLAQFQEGVGEQDLFMEGFDLLKCLEDRESGKTSSMESAKQVVNSEAQSEGQRELWKKFNVRVEEEMKMLEIKLAINAPNKNPGAPD